MFCNSVSDLDRIMKSSAFVLEEKMDQTVCFLIGGLIDSSVTKKSPRFYKQLLFFILMLIFRPQQ